MVSKSSAPTTNAGGASQTGSVSSDSKLTHNVKTLDSQSQELHQGLKSGQKPPQQKVDSFHRQFHQTADQYVADSGKAVQGTSNISGKNSCSSRATGPNSSPSNKTKTPGTMGKTPSAASVKTSTSTATKTDSQSARNSSSATPNVHPPDHLNSDALPGLISVGDSSDPMSNLDSGSQPVAQALLTKQNGAPVTANILSNGTLQKIPDSGSTTQTSPSNVGTIDSRGNFKLTDPQLIGKQNGNVFNDGSIAINATTPFSNELIQSSQEHARRNSFQALFPQLAHLTQNGKPLNGAGVKVLVFDDGTAHQKAINKIINDIAPGAVPSFASPLGRSLDFNSIPTFGEFSTKWIATNINGRTDDVQGAVNKYHPDIVNMSNSLDKLGLAQDIVNSLSTPFYGAAQDPDVSKLRNPALSQDDRLKLATQYVDHLFQTNSEIQAAVKRWDDFVKNASVPKPNQKGTIFVLSTGNTGNTSSRLNLPNEYGFSLYAENPNVISAAASNPNNTPNLSDDTIPGFSSRGSSQYPPTVAAPGQAVLLPSNFGETLGFKDGVDYGTSFATPEVTGTIALMLQKNPNLTPDQVEFILKHTAVKTAAPVEAEGSGMLNPPAAINAVPLPSTASKS